MKLNELIARIEGEAGFSLLWNRLSPEPEQFGHTILPIEKGFRCY